MTGGEYVTKSSLTPSRLRSGSKPSGISFLWFSYTKYISNRTLTLSQGPKLKFHFLIASHVTKSLNRRLTAITKQRGSAPLTPAGAYGPWTVTAQFHGSVLHTDLTQNSAKWVLKSKTPRKQFCLRCTFPRRARRHFIIEKHKCVS